jgi:hypothetical protein
MFRRANRVLGCVATVACIFLWAATAAFATPVRVWSDPFEHVQLSGQFALADHRDGSSELKNIATGETREILGDEPYLSGDWVTWVEGVPRQDDMPESALHVLQISTGITRTLTSSDTVGNGVVWGDWATYIAGNYEEATDTQFVVNLRDGRQWSIPYGVNTEVQGVSPTAAFVQEDDGSASFWNLTTGTRTPFPFETWIAQHDPSGTFAGVARFYRNKLLIADQSSAWSVDPVTEATTLLDKESDRSAQPILSGAEAYGSDWGAWVGNPDSTAKHMMLMLGNLSTREFRRLDVAGGAVDEHGSTGDNFKGWSTDGDRVIYSVDRGATDPATGTFVETITALPRVRRITMKRTPSAATYVIKDKNLANKNAPLPSLRVTLVVTNDAGVAVPNATVELHLRPKGWDDDVTLQAPKTDSKGRISLVLPNDYMRGRLSTQGLRMIGAWSHIGRKNDYLAMRWHVSAKSGAYFEATSPWTKIKAQ